MRCSRTSTRVFFQATRRTCVPTPRGGGQCRFVVAPRPEEHRGTPLVRPEPPGNWSRVRSLRLVDASVSGRATGHLLYHRQSPVGSTADPRLFYPIDPNNFQLPKNYAPFARGIIGNMPPILTYGPGLEIFNLSLLKEFKVRESHRLQFKVEATNALNHYNPSNLNMGITRNYTTGANTNAAFGTIQGTQFQSRRAIVSVRYSF